MAHCDLCGAHCKAGDLGQLLAEYQTAGVQDVCPACEKWATKIKFDLVDEIPGQMRAAIAERKGMPPTPWWRRLLGWR